MALVGAWKQLAQGTSGLEDQGHLFEQRMVLHVKVELRWFGANQVRATMVYPSRLSTLPLDVK
jgi:hypothetical protein